MTLHRDPTQAANGLSPIFDKQKELERMQEAQLIGEVGQQATQMVVSHHLDKANQKAKDDPEYANSKEYKALQEKWGIGSNFQRGMQAATAALQGLAGGDLTQAAAGAASPYLAQMVKQQTDDGPSRVMAHALVQGALAAAQNKNAMVGATGAATGELVGMMATQLYHKDASQLTEGEKETVSTLATLAAGLAGGLTGDSTAEVLAGAQTGKTVVENNWLSETESWQFDKELSDCKKSGGDCSKVIEKYIDKSNENSKKLANSCTGGGVTCVSWEEIIQANTNIAMDADPQQIRLSEKLKDPDAAAIVKYLNGTDLKFLKDNITTGDRVMDVVLTPTSWPVALMGGKAIITNGVKNTKEQLIAVVSQGRRMQVFNMVLPVR